MANYKKGIEMRQHIIREARKVYNEEGLQLTLDQLAGKLNLTKGRITNYFPTKDDLFVALSQDYDTRFQELMMKFGGEKKMSFEWLVTVFSAIMDLQYAYRSAIIFVAATNSSQKEMHHQITKSYKTNSKQVLPTIEGLLNAGLVKPTILEPKIFEVFFFQHMNLFTTWVISLEIYYSASSYKKMKPVYLKGILSSYFPYLTPKGHNQIATLGI
jgi:AcrR family transcriptional regulator